MFELARSPYGGHGCEEFLAAWVRLCVCIGSAEPSSATSAVVRDGCVAANSAAGANAPSTR